MKPVVRVKLLPSAEQARALEATLEACNRAADHASQTAQATGARNKFALQKAVYHDLKVTYGLSAQPVVRVIAEVVREHEVVDLTLREPDIETVVSSLYKGVAPAEGAGSR